MPNLREWKNQKILLAFLVIFFIFFGLIFLFYILVSTYGGFEPRSAYYDLELKLSNLVNQKSQIERLNEDIYHYEGADLYGVLKLEGEEVDQCSIYTVGGKLIKATNDWVLIDTGKQWVKLLKNNEVDKKTTCFIQKRTISEEIEGETVTCLKESLPLGYDAFATVEICENDKLANYNYLLLSPPLNDN